IIVRMIDSFMYFVHQGGKKLKAGGLLGMILPDVLLYQSDNQKLRGFILDNFAIRQILNLGNVFEKVTRPAAILIIESKGRASRVEAADLSSLGKATKSSELKNPKQFVAFPQTKIREVPGFLFVTSDLARYAVWSKITAAPNQR